MLVNAQLQHAIKVSTDPTINRDTVCTKQGCNIPLAKEKELSAIASICVRTDKSPAKIAKMAHQGTLIKAPM